MTLADVRSRLAGLEGRAYWRSLEELADTPDFKEYVHREFPDQASEFNDPAGRRTFLKLMGASLALAGVSACTRQPEEKLVPYVKQPEEIVPGRPLYYATAMPQGGVGVPLLAENHMGRPTKLEGNPEHPASLGASDILSQASVLNLYDPDRSRTVIERGDVKTWSAFVTAMQAAMTSHRALQGAGLRILTEPITSPSLVDQIHMLLEDLPQAKWHQWDAVYGARQGGAPGFDAIYHFAKADVVVSLDADFLGWGPAQLRYTKDFSSRRRLNTPADALNRLYVAEPVTTVTGANADHRVAVKAREIQDVVVGLATGVGVNVGAPAGTLADDVRSKWIPAVVADLKANAGKCIVVAGDHQPAAVHALARSINQQLGNVGQTVHYVAPIAASPADGTASIVDLVAEMNAGKVDMLVMLGGNPVFNAPADLNFVGALDKVGLRVHLGTYVDETAERCHWHVNEAHYLEMWGDVRAFDGTVSLIQPLIAPIYDGHSALEVVGALNGTAKPGLDLVKDYWTRAFGGQTKDKWPLSDGNGRAFATADAFWRHTLHDGFISSTSSISTPPSTSYSAPAAPAVPAPVSPATGSGPSIEIVFRPDPHILDGRNANNGWLQELPKPLSKVVWDNVAYMNPRTAERLGISTYRVGNQNQELIDITLPGRRSPSRIPVWIMPGTADDVVAVHFGYGSKKSGRVGKDVGHNVFPLRSSTAPWFESGAQIAKSGETYLVASTQNHFAMEGRNPVRAVDLTEYRTNPQSVAALGHNRPPKTLTLYNPDEHQYNGNKWGMTLDLNACTGCGVCVAACVAENNIPVVGKVQVSKSREMHWLRVDTYYAGDANSPSAIYHQPVPCQQCENAPCETVCPVAATVHSDEGLNDMVYNRCVGTRYCSNNCPYKVRRFNFMLYQDFYTPELKPQRNPDVTIRSRGVMEKCTYCVQRINHARIDAKTAGNPIADGAIVTACEQACPANAIVFGDMNDPNSRVAKLKAQERNYGVLEDLGTRPRTSYLAKVRNPNPAL